MALSSIAIAKNLKYTLLFPPLIVAVCAIALTLAGDASWLYGGLLALWGLMIGFIPVSWTSWVTLPLSTEAGAAGCMQIGIMQMAIAAGVLSGGLLIAPFGTSAPLLFGAGLLVIAVLIIAMGVEQRRAP